MAMYEAEPAAVQATVKSSLASLRNVQHKDVFGNPIGALCLFSLSLFSPVVAEPI